MSSYYADGSWGNNQYQPFSGVGGMNMGFTPVQSGAFQASPLFGGGSSYYDTANDGKIGLEQFLGSGQGGQTLNGNKFASYVRNNYGNLWNQYGASQGQNPSQSWSDFLTKNQDSLQQQYAGQNPYDKGEQGQKKLQWL